MVRHKARDRIRNNSWNNYVSKYYKHETELNPTWSTTEVIRELAKRYHAKRAKLLGLLNRGEDSVSGQGTGQQSVQELMQCLEQRQKLADENIKLKQDGANLQAMYDLLKNAYSEMESKLQAAKADIIVKEQREQALQKIVNDQARHLGSHATVSRNFRKDQIKNVKALASQLRVAKKKLGTSHKKLLGCIKEGRSKSAALRKKLNVLQQEYTACEKSLMSVTLKHSKLVIEMKALDQQSHADKGVIERLVDEKRSLQRDLESCQAKKKRRVVQVGLRVPNKRQSLGIQVRQRERAQ